MGGLDPAKLLVILVLALILLGPERLPKAARQVGAFWRDLTRLRERLEQEVREAVPDLDLPELPRLRPGGVTSYLTDMMRSAGSSETEPSGEVALAEEEAQKAATSPVALAASGGAGGIPAGWHTNKAVLPGYASGSHLSALPAGTPEGTLVADLRLELDDPSWN